MSRLIRRVAIVAAGALALSAGGCYERVVGARGFGADNVQVHQPERTYLPGVDPPRKSAPRWSRDGD